MSAAVTSPPSSESESSYTLKLAKSMLRGSPTLSPLNSLAAPVSFVFLRTFKQRFSLFCFSSSLSPYFMPVRLNTSPASRCLSSGFSSLFCSSSCFCFCNASRRASSLSLRSSRLSCLSSSFASSTMGATAFGLWPPRAGSLEKGFRGS